MGLLWLLFAAMPACAGKTHADLAAPASSRAEASAEPREGADAGVTPDSAATLEHDPLRAVVPLPGQQTAFLGALGKVSNAAQQLARTSGHEVALAAGDVLSAMADALETLPDPDHQTSKAVTEVRFEAKRLRRSDRLSYTLPRWIKEGLVAAVDGLERLTPASDNSRFWIGAAKESHKSIDTKSSLTFQRAPVQDAVRTTIDAFFVVGQGLCVCR